MNQPNLAEPYQQVSECPEISQSRSSATALLDLQRRQYGIPAWLPRVAGVLLPSPKLWKHRRRVQQRSNAGWNWQFIVPALLLMLAMQSLFIWQLYSPITAPLELVETEIEIEIPIDLSTLELENEPDASNQSAQASAEQPKQSAKALEPVLAAKPQPAPTKPSLPAVSAQLIEQPAAPIAKAIVTAPSLAINIPMSAAILEPAAEQGVLDSEGLTEAEIIAPLLEQAEQVVDTEITLAPMSLPITPEIAVPIRPAVPLEIAQEKPKFEPSKPRLTPAAPITINVPSVATLPERVEIETLKPMTEKPSLAISEIIEPQPINELSVAAAPPEVLPRVRPDRSTIEQFEPVTQVQTPQRLALATPSIARSDTPTPVAAQADAAPESPANLEIGEANAANSPSATTNTQSGAQLSGSDSSGLDLYGAIGQAAADQAALNAPKDTRNAFRRYDDPFADDQPSRLKGLRMREPQLFLDIAKYLVSQLNNAGVGYALVQLGANEEIDDFTDADLGPLIKAWTDLHHGDLTTACRRENSNLLPAMRDVLCGTNN